MGKDKFERKLFFACLLILATAGVYVLGYYTKVWTTPDTLVELEYILELIEENYIGEFDKDAFISSAVKGSLDKYSSYYTPVDYTEVTLSRDGVSQGKMGMGFLTTSNGVIVYSVEGNSPAERANIPVGGQILGIKRVDDAEFTAVSTYDEWNAFYTTLKKNEQVTVKILYGEEREYTLAREDYSISYVWYQDGTGAYNMTYEDKEWKLVKREIPLKSHINDGYAYIKLSTFSGKAYEQVKLALDKMKANGNTKLIFDLRSNGGGYMNILTDIAGCLAPGKDKQAISKAVYKNGKEDVFYSSKNYYNDYGFEKIAVLANSGTASASEALIGAILDYDASYNKNIATVIVEQTDTDCKTYGKGIMQTTYTFSTGSAIKLTTAEICWPVSNVCIHNKGVTPQTDARVKGVKMQDGEDSMLLAAMAE